MKERWLGIWRVNRNSFDCKWGYFAPRFGFTFLINRGGYFDQHYSITLCFIWGVLHITLPWKTRIEETCDAPRYGIDIHGCTFWIHLGGAMDADWHQCNSKWVTWELPWFSQTFDWHKVWTGQEWVDPEGYSKPYADGRLVETHPYTYILQSGEVQSRIADVYMERRQSHRKWFPFLKKVSTGINVAFDEEVGEKSGSWKGGCIGCGWNIHQGESMLDSLRRMERDRKF